MISLATVIFYIFSFINLIATKNIYWPYLKNYVHILSTIFTFTNSWESIFLFHFIYVKAICTVQICKFKQWLNQTIEPLGNNRYLITHQINGETVKMIIMKRKKNVVAVVDENYNNCFLDKAKPFLLYEEEEFYPETIDLNIPLIIHMEDSDPVLKNLKPSKKEN